jgi:hypothetical protein
MRFVLDGFPVAAPFEADVGSERSDSWFAGLVFDSEGKAPLTVATYVTTAAAARTPRSCPRS